MKELLNIKITKVSDKILEATEVLSLRLQIENNNEVELDILKSQDKYYAVYRFLKAPSTDKLRLLAQNVTDYYYQISEADFERLKDVIR